jgi:hypothetical protein
MTAAEYACGYVIEFEDDGPIEGQFLHVGDEESCRRTLACIHAISYSGNRPVKRSESFCVPRGEGMDAGRVIRIEKPKNPPNPRRLDANT